jgi:hypothetical protein
MKTTREVITELSKKVQEIQLKVVELPKKVKTLEGEIARAIEYNESFVIVDTKLGKVRYHPTKVFDPKDGRSIATIQKERKDAGLPYEGKPGLK